jgi:hypothetical protein
VLKRGGLIAIVIDEYRIHNNMSNIFHEEELGRGQYTPHSRTDSNEWLSDMEHEREKTVGNNGAINDINIKVPAEDEIPIRATKSYDEPPDGGKEAWIQACCAHLVSPQSGPCI